MKIGKPHSWIIEQVLDFSGMDRHRWLSLHGVLVRHRIQTSDKATATLEDGGYEGQ
ncbi:MAG: hypothetical protein SGJ26_21140 [Nitrospirota bacterium]|nr:hypothetical protein [Nitrospirota bacterium]